MSVVAFGKKYLELGIVMSIAAMFWLVGASYDVFEVFNSYSRSHESYEVDELVWAILCFGNAGLFYMLRYQLQKNKEIKRRIRAEDDLEWLSKHDSLTRLPNRRYLQKLMDDNCCEAYTAKFKRFGLLSLDLNDFKKANDLLGHKAGDTVLKEISERIMNAKGVELAFRLGGDEFLAFTNIPSNTDPVVFADEIARQLVRPIEVDGTTQIVGVSVGLSILGEDADTLSDAIHFADLAMYSAKRSRTKRVARFEPEMLITNMERAQLEKDLLNAIANNEIKPFYQPLVDLETGEISGFEALARWNRKGHGFVPPTEFIRIAEEIGVITELSDHLLRVACLDAQKWPDTVSLSFNISPLQLSDPHLGLRILKLLNEVDFPPHRLELEITETALINELDTATEIIYQMHQLGIRISLDDFGTGYSNLSQLSHLDFNKIKIDRSFIDSFQTDEKRMTIVKSMLALGSSLGMETTAEGVETSNQLAALIELGCSRGQGYYLGTPASSEETLKLLETPHSRGFTANA
ncbi:diguanylate cyclase (GGDEF) domain-containing protein [Cohaesibacter marisflavi]|uniref:Diguanylate cyclase (GGDEF) domain-containing protein n=1 Tax=Cohaesibacter marisflavi TaxID=655353 RepID=A0A1I5BWB2_9HYPH|nr:EAL domain-containing protein [Cohaesibacter marisflavi]SFN79099.1 diguanylate cyclase (GGDEF) domain-containing protein [Cohaesibacter marisflavi]